MELLVGFERGAMERNREAEKIWTDFAASVRVPFSYDSFRARAYPKEVGGVAAATFVTRAHEDYRDREYVRIVLGAHFTDANPNERFLTLLHESIHLARNTGALRRINDVKLELCQRYDHNVDPASLAFRLAEQILEADAEFCLKANYPEHAAARANYYADMQRGRVAQRPWNGLRDENKPYGMLGYMLRLDLAIALLNHDGGALAQVEAFRTQLSHELATLDLDSATRTTLDRVHEILSPTRSDFETVADWGPGAYCDVLTMIVEPHSMRSTSEVGSGEANSPRSAPTGSEE
jgi:hypothetical protein